MKCLSIPLVTALLAFLTSTSIRAQALEQQFQQADAELNRVYGELRGRLSDTLKEDLKQSQRQWIAQRDSLASTAKSPKQRLEFLKRETIRRTAALQAGVYPVSSGGPASTDGGLLIQLREADGILNDIYKKRMKVLDKPSQEQLRSEQRAWLASRDSDVSAAGTQDDKNRTLLRETNKRIQQLQDASSMTGRPQASFEDYGFDERMFLQGGVQPIYQDVPWDSANVIADTSYGPFRAITVLGSNRVYIFDRRSRLLFGSIEAGRGPLAENDPPALLAFTGSGRFLYSESGGHKTIAYQLSYIPALMPALVGACYKKKPIGPVRDKDGRIGVYEPTELGEQSNINESASYNFQSVAGLLSLGDNETSVFETFAREYPSIAQRVGLFRRPNSSTASSGRGVTVTKGLEVSIDGALSDAHSKLDASGRFTERQPYQVLAMHIRNDEIVLLEDVDCRQAWTSISPRMLTKDNGRGMPLFFVRHPDVALGAAGAWISSGPLICKIDPPTTELGSVNSPATLKEISGAFECRVPPVPDPEAAGRLDWQGRRNTMFQMAFYYPWPQPLIIAYWMYPDKNVTDYAMGVFNPSNGKWIYTQENNRSGRSASEVSRHCY